MLQADFCKPIKTPSDEKSIHQVFSSLNWPKENEFDGNIDIDRVIVNLCMYIVYIHV